MSTIGLPFLKPDDQPPCQANPHLFFDDEFVPDDIPEGLSPRSRQAEQQRSQRRQVRLLCGGCPFRVECAEYAIVHERDGWWAGLSPKDREDARRARGVSLQVPRVNTNNQEWVLVLRRQEEQKSKSRMYEREYRAQRARETISKVNGKVTA